MAARAQTGVGRLAGAVADWLYPPRCACCGGGAVAGFRSLCWECRSRLAFIEFPFCDRCGDPVEGRVDGPYACGWCRRHPPAFDRARSVVRYRGAARDCLLALKYGDALSVAADLAGWLASCVDVHYRGWPVDAVTWVPLHPRRRRRRGYNQAEMLGRALAGRLGLPASGAGLRRTRETGSQTRLNAARRRVNVRGAFVSEAADWVDGRSLLLVDDVMTTGATVDACARALKAAGAVRVGVVTVGRG